MAATAQRVTRILHWSQWRRWHQAWACYYHYRQRQGHTPPAPQQDATTPAPTLLDMVWHRLESLLPPTHQTGRPWTHERRLVLEAIVYVMQTDCAWRALPARFPPWQTVYAQFARWRSSGLWATIWTGLEQPYAPG